MVKVVVILSDEDNPHSITIAFASQRTKWCTRFSVHTGTGETQCIKAPRPVEDDEMIMTANSIRESEVRSFKPPLMGMKVDPNGYKLNVVAYYDDAFYQKFGRNSTRASTRVASIMELVDEKYSESSFETKIEITTRDIKHATGYN